MSDPVPMSSPDDDESIPPAAAAVPLGPSFLQPSRRSRLGRGLRQSQERRIPGAPVPPGDDAEDESVAAAAGESDAPSLTTEPVPVREEYSSVDSEPRTVAYRPPSRNTETLWAGNQSASVPDSVYPGGPPSRWRLPLLLLLLGLGIGGGLGFLLAGGTARTGAGANRATARASSEPDAVAPLSPFAEMPADILAATVTDLDNAYGALRAGKFADADASLRAAQERRPSPPGARLSGAVAGWPEVEVERARVRFYAGDLQGADRALDTLLRAPGVGPARADALLLRALVQGALRAPSKADELFAAAVAANPVRADTFFFWGNALRTEGKPAESIPKFRAAQLRNQFETMDGLIRLKLWTSQLQVDKEAPEAVAAIDAALAAPSVPTGYAWMGAAARAIREGRFADAADRFRKARVLLDPVLYRVVLSDPVFAEQSWRPELAEFFRQPNVVK